MWRKERGKGPLHQGKLGGGGQWGGWQERGLARQVKVLWSHGKE